MTSLRQLYGAFNLLPRLVDPLTDQAYEFVLQKNWTHDLGNNPHGHAWHTSFHASQFPFDEEKACPRKAVYQMQNFAGLGPADRKLVGMGEVGKAIEVCLTEKWHAMGVLLSPPPTEPIQLGAVEEKVWLSTSFDSVILPIGWKRPLPVEIKSKALNKVREMIMGERGPDDQHVAQLKVQLYFLHKNQSEWWPDLEPVQSGVIYYLARDDPSITKEFEISLDIEWVERRFELLRAWKRNFEAEEIEQTQTKSHPLGWKWSELPCKWCTFKKHVCKPDFQSKIITLAESHGIEYTKEQRHTYDYDEARKEVFDRWE